MASRTGRGSVTPLSVIEVLRGAGKAWWWRHKAPNGRILCHSEQYPTRTHAFRAAKSQQGRLKAKIPIRVTTG